MPELWSTCQSWAPVCFVISVPPASSISLQLNVQQLLGYLAAFHPSDSLDKENSVNQQRLMTLTAQKDCVIALGPFPFPGWQVMVMNLWHSNEGKGVHTLTTWKRLGTWWHPNFMDSVNLQNLLLLIFCLSYINKCNGCLGSATLFCFINENLHCCAGVPGADDQIMPVFRSAHAISHSGLALHAFVISRESANQETPGLSYWRTFNN